MAPIAIFFYIMRLFFRAPLAAIFASFVCGVLALLLFFFTHAIAADMSPFGSFIFMMFMLCIAAGIAYGIRSFGFSAAMFNLECYALEKAVLNFGILGRAFYVFAQIIPGLVLASLVLGTLLSSQGGNTTTNADLAIGGLILSWFALSQFMVLRFHRTEHPVGQFLSFTGLPLTEVNQEHSERSLTTSS